MQQAHAFRFQAQSILLSNHILSEHFTNCETEMINNILYFYSYHKQQVRSKGMYMVL